MKENIITVSGHGGLRIQPDTAAINCTVSALNHSYAEANREMNRRTELLRKTLPGVGLKRTDLKTLDFAVRRQNEHDPKTHKLNFVGYNAYHLLGLRLPLDEKLNRVMETLLGSKADAQVDVSFTVADPEPMHARLLIAAVKNARERAEVIAHAAGVRPGKIANITKHGIMEMRVQHVSSHLVDPGTPGIEAGNFSVSDNVTVTWEILE